MEAAGQQAAAGEATAATAGPVEAQAEAEGGNVVRPEQLSPDQLQVGVVGGCGALDVVLGQGVRSADAFLPGVGLACGAVTG